MSKWLSVLLVVAAVATVAAVAASGRRAPAQSSSDAGAAGGMVIYRDPATGELGEPPPEVSEKLAPRVLQTPPPMVEQPGTTAGGGVLLRGIPPTSMTATAGADGTASTHCTAGGTRDEVSH